MEHIVQIFKALSDETRLKVLIILSRRQICAKGIAKHLNISEAAVSQHIKVLKEAGLIAGEKKGYFMHYDLQNSLLEEIINFLEKMNCDHSITQCNLDLNIPIDCKSSCKVNKNKCCHKNIK